MLRKWFKLKNQFLSDEKGNVFYEFLMIFLLVLVIGFLFAGFALSQMDTPDGMRKARNLFIMAFCFSLGITVAYNAVAKFVGHGLFLGSNKRDDAGILRGMYRQANGLRISSQPEQSEKIYKQILIEYPDELEARFYLGDLIWKDLKQGKRALRELKALERKIRQEKLDFKYLPALEENIGNLKEELEEPRQT